MNISAHVNMNVHAHEGALESGAELRKQSLAVAATGKAAAQGCFFRLPLQQQDAHSLDSRPQKSEASCLLAEGSLQTL